MPTLQLHSTNQEVQKLQEALIRWGTELTINGVFDEPTYKAVKSFQESHGLYVDGIVGPITWMELEAYFLTNDLNVDLSNYLLRGNEYMKTEHDKTTIYLHHTAGGYRPDYTIDWWESDNNPGKVYRVATSFVIGRKHQEDDSYDGKIYRCFDERLWAHHLGLGEKHNNTSSNKNAQLNAQSIGIEICNYGFLEKNDDKFYFRSSKDKLIEVPADEVDVLEKPWRGQQYFHKYTETQLAACQKLILALSRNYNISLPETTYTADWFDLKYDAIIGKPGIWTHCNVRYDKTDCYPSKALINMLNNLSDSTPRQRGMKTNKEPYVKHTNLKRKFTPKEWHERKNLVRNYSKQ